MVAWGEARRDLDPGFFCRMASMGSAGNHKPAWVISDARRLSGETFFA